jgi:hypothetical protein
MDLGPLRALVRELTMSAFSVPATVTVPYGLPVETTGIWVQSPDEPQPFGHELTRREPRHVMAIPRTLALDTIPRGTVILAADVSGGAVRSWRVDGIDRVEADLNRVILALQVNP